ncbi:MAG: Asp-tRNA(Asn)/Glu-tRNA(Gln) amidotransferase subunit GatC [bacterium]
MISKEEIKHIAELARIGLSETEIEKMGKELSAILDHMDTLKKVDVSQVDSTSFSVLIENTMREDEIKEAEPTVIERLLETVPEKKGKLVKVKTVLGSNE